MISTEGSTTFYPAQWFSTKIMTIKHLKNYNWKIEWIRNSHFTDMDILYAHEKGSFTFEDYRANIKSLSHYSPNGYHMQFLTRAGHHFSSVFPPELMIQKLRSFSHQEYLNKHTLSEETSLKAYLCRITILRHEIVMVLPLEEFMGSYLIRHVKKVFPKYIEETDKIKKVDLQCD
jgi:hypothetical protein